MQTFTKFADKFFDIFEWHNFILAQRRKDSKKQIKTNQAKQKRKKRIGWEWLKKIECKDGLDIIL